MTNIFDDLNSGVGKSALAIKIAINSFLKGKKYLLFLER